MVHRMDMIKSEQINFFIGVNDLVTEGTYLTEDGDDVYSIYTNYWGTEPNNRSTFYHHIQ